MELVQKDSNALVVYLVQAAIYLEELDLFLFIQSSKPDKANMSKNMSKNILKDFEQAKEITGYLFNDIMGVAQTNLLSYLILLVGAFHCPRYTL